MKIFNVKPNNVTYGAMIGGFIKNNEIKEALSLVNKGKLMLDAGKCEYVRIFLMLNDLVFTQFYYSMRLTFRL